MADATIGPVILAVAGDTYVRSARICIVLWVGSTSAGNSVELICPVTQKVLWVGLTSSSYTYLGANFGGEGLNAPHGFKLNQLSAGRVFVYLRES